PEPLGAVALEAMAAGSAVVASRIGGLDTVLVDDHNGLLIEPDDVAAWTGAITSLLAHPERARRLSDQAQRDMSGVEIEHHIDALDEIRRRASSST
ncbi:MAG: glycosyltransferase family 4 protein, partial [Nocardioidaceae bacterium]|nr:glycosyltransferase family 4 protein [Nocardioidaceae bacterium]